MYTWTIIGVVAGACTVIMAAMQWMISRAIKKGSNEQRVKNLEVQFEAHFNKSLDCEKRFIQLEERKIDGKSLKDLSEDIAFMKGSLSTIKEALFSLDRSRGSLIQSYSPISLTETGEKIAKEMDITTRISNNWYKICEYLDENLSSKNAYDIQQLCIETASVFLERFFRDEDINDIKNFAYNEGKPLVYYGGMIGVMIRDTYFQYKNISIDDIDKHDPAKQG